MFLLFWCTLVLSVDEIQPNYNNLIDTLSIHILSLKLSKEYKALFAYILNRDCRIRFSHMLLDSLELIMGSDVRNKSYFGFAAESTYRARQ